MREIKITRKELEDMSAPENVWMDENLEKYLVEVGKVKILTEAEEKELLEKSRTGDKEAQKALVEANLRLVVSVAKKYIHRGVMFLDLIREGNDRLVKIVEEHSCPADCRFSDYVASSVADAMEMEISGLLIDYRITPDMQKYIEDMAEVTRQLKDELGREPTNEEIYSALNKKSRDQMAEILRENKPTEQ